MDHSLQHQYLQTLGVLQYVPKDTVYEDVVADSKPVPKIAVPVSAAEGFETAAKLDAGLDQSRNQAPNQAPNQGIAKKPIDVAALVNLGLDDNPAAPAKAKVAATKPPVAENSQPTAVIEVKFSLWQITDELLVCSAVEGALAETAEMQLLSNMLNAIGCGIGRLPQMDLIEWPPYPNAPNDEAEAREYLATLLEAKLAGKPVKTVLLLGESAADWLISPDKVASDKAPVALSEQTTALLLPSLATMIDKPQKKAVAWQVLQVLPPTNASSV